MVYFQHMLERPEPTLPDPHRKLYETVITALHERMATSIFPKAKAHMKQPLNEEDVAEAEKGTRMDAAPLSPWGTTVATWNMIQTG